MPLTSQLPLTIPVLLFYLVVTARVLAHVHISGYTNENEPSTKLQKIEKKLTLKVGAKHVQTNRKFTERQIPRTNLKLKRLQKPNVNGRRPNLQTHEQRRSYQELSFPHHSEVKRNENKNTLKMHPTEGGQPIKLRLQQTITASTRPKSGHNIRHRQLLFKGKGLTNWTPGLKNTIHGLSQPKTGRSSNKFDNRDWGRVPRHTARRPRSSTEVRVTHLNKDHPWLVEMHIYSENDWFPRNCTATVVTRSVMVAQGQCFDDIKNYKIPDMDIVTVVMNKYFEPDVRHKFGREIYLEDDGDVAIIEIYGHFRDELQKVTLPTKSIVQEAKTLNCMVSSLDAHEYGIVYQISMQVVPKKACEAKYLKMLRSTTTADVDHARLSQKVLKDKVCLAASGAFCQYYFRGPLICHTDTISDAVLYGVFYRLLDTCTAGVSSVNVLYTDIYAHINWINTELGIVHKPIIYEHDQHTEEKPKNSIGALTTKVLIETTNEIHSTTSSMNALNTRGNNDIADIDVGQLLGLNTESAHTDGKYATTNINYDTNENTDSQSKFDDYQKDDLKVGRVVDNTTATAASGASSGRGADVIITVMVVVVALA